MDASTGVIAQQGADSRKWQPRERRATDSNLPERAREQRREQDAAATLAWIVFESRRTHLSERLEPPTKMDRVCRACLEEHCGSRDESPSSNLGRVKQLESIQVDNTGPQSQGGSGKGAARSISTASAAAVVESRL